jgi:hypothetical protein
MHKSALTNGVDMRTTLDIDDGLLAKAKSQAAKEHTSLTQMIEQGLALRLRPRKSTAKQKRHALPVYAGKGGLHAAVLDAASHRALLDAADDVR